MHLARNKDDEKLVLVQVDPEFTFSKAERGKPRVVLMDNNAFGAGAYLRLDNPISATFTTADVTLPRSGTSAIRTPAMQERPRSPREKSA